MHISELDTPSLLLDMDVMGANLQRMSAYCAATGMSLRPHIKTHKIPALAHMQLALGAIGVTAAKPGEAEIMAAGGIDDIFVAYPIVSDVKANHLLSLMDKARLSVSIDSVEAADCLSRSASAQGRSLSVLVEIDVGFHRCGVANAQAVVTLAQHIDKLPGLTFGGLMFYPGHLFVPSAEQDVLLAEVNLAVETAYNALERCGLNIQTVSGGSTPTAYRSTEFSHLTEIRPGMYLLNDCNLVKGGFATLAECALTVLTTVVSISVPQRAIIDGGSKTFSSDRLLTGDGQGFGTILEDEAVVLYGLSEEHGHLNIAASSHTYRVGERLRIVPNHVCTTINMHDTIYGIRGDIVQEVWPVAARGRAQ